jgi:hypothetical protein
MANLRAHSAFLASHFSSSAAAPFAAHEHLRDKNSQNLSCQKRILARSNFLASVHYVLRRLVAVSLEPILRIIGFSWKMLMEFASYLIFVPIPGCEVARHRE